MSTFKLKAKAVEIITTSDGKEFYSMAEAEAHQFALENAEVINTVTESYLNKRELIDRNRQQKKNVAADIVGFIIESGIDLSGVAVVERIKEDSPKVEVAATEEADADTDAPADADTDAPADAETEELF